MGSWPTLLGQTDRACLDILGGAVRYSPGVGSPVDVTGIFDATYQRADAGEGGVGGFTPAVFLLLADLPSDPEGDTAAKVTVGTQPYEIREVHKDGQGGVVLFLWKD